MRTIEIMALGMLAAACDGELMAGLPKQVVKIPITGGLDTNTGPLAQVPGTFLQLDDVRQERRHEWRNRNGITHDNALDDVPGTVTPQPPLLTAELPEGSGVVGLSQLELVANASDKSAALVYDRTAPSGVARWQRKTPYYDAPMAPPGIWNRKGVSSEALPIGVSTIAIGTTGMRLIAWDVRTDGITQGGINYMLTTSAGVPLFGPTAAGDAFALLPRAVYVNGIFLLFYASSADANLRVIKLAEATATFVTSATLKSDMDTTGLHGLDAIVYPGSASVTVAYRQFTSGFVRQLEINPTTLGLSVDISLGVNGFNCVALLPDPDASGRRFIAVGTATPDVRVLITSSLAAIISNDQASTDTAQQIAGTAYQAGAGWQIVWRLQNGTGIRANKKRSGSVGTAITIVGDVDMYLDTNAWREAGTDTMRYVLGLHRSTVIGTSIDYQHTYYEMALEFDNNSSSVTGAYRTPQAILVPQNAEPDLAVGYQPTQVVRTGTQRFALALPRLTNAKRAAAAAAGLHAVDVWTVEYVTPGILAARPNIGPGVTGPQAAYIPAGVLIQSATGQRVEGHGGSAIPRPPQVVLSAGAGLNANQVYNWLVSIDYPDDNGNIWRGPLSLATSATPTGSDLQATVTALLPGLDSPSRRRIVNFWRTRGNGAITNDNGEYVVQLVRVLSADGSVSSIGFTDAVPDTTLASSSFPHPGLQTALTPAFNHIAFFDGRMWGAERDFPSRVRFTHRNQAGISPEFPSELFVDIEDEYGDVTGIYSLDDKLIVTKESAIYFCQQGGPGLDGTGGAYTFTRLNTEIGHQAGTPAISTGSTVWFFHGGMYSIDRSLHITHHDAIERYFNHPLLTTPEVPISLTYNGKRDEIRLLTTNYRFVYDTENAVWIRDTGGPAGALLTQTLTEVGDMFFRSNGQVWWDYDVDSGTADASGAIRGVLRSAWIRAAQPEGYFRIYRERALYKIEASGALTSWPETTIYFNDNDAISATTTRTGTSGTTKQTTEARTARGKAASFSIAERLPAGNVTWRLSQWSVLLALKKAMHADAPSALGR